MTRSCHAKNAAGEPCGAAPLRGGEFCRMHSPELADDVAEARRLGGLRRRREVAVSGEYDLNGLDSAPAIQRLLEIAALDTLELENSVARSRALAYIASVATRALETGKLEDRLAALEAALAPRRLRA